MHNDKVGRFLKHSVEWRFSRAPCTRGTGLAMQTYGRDHWSPV